MAVICKTRLSLMVLLSAFWSSAGAADCSKECKLNQVEAYFTALAKVSRQGSSIEDIDSLLEAMHEDVKYIHFEYGADFDKDKWRKAFIRNLNRNFYNKTNAHHARVLRAIYGKSHIAVEYSHGVVKEDGVWHPEEPRLAVFGFSDGKISLVEELW
ncbi:hypothetical protein [uncultured Pseudoteredinibacter sp.]|uniref:hypothetical protein n=1 Tax=uncultured Pseudoteredinibacter sp. TaxID=1641701 RepID=UPI002635DDB0|nr:hypothetical protein [uncultured Pseudoteredinibacter sp.]